MLFLLLTGILELQRTEQQGAFSPEEYIDAGTIRLASGSAVSISDVAVLIGSEATSYFLVHLKQPVDQVVLERLRKDGLEPIGYMAHQNVICRRTRGRGLPVSGVEKIIPFLPTFKLAPEFAGSYGANRVRIEKVICALWPGEDATLVASQIAAIGGSVQAILPRAVVAEADPLTVVELDGVAWVQRCGEAEPFNVNVQWVMQIGWLPVVPDPIQGRRVWQYGLRGQNMVIGLFDSGINTWHRMFVDSARPITQPGIYLNHRKIVAYKLFREAVFGDASALGWHGSGVAGTLAGNDQPSGDSTEFDGIAPDARIYFLDVGSYSRFIYYDDLTEMLDSVRLGLGMPEPPRQVSGSFGSRDALGYYRLAEASLDAVCWQDKEFLVVWAAGNDGGDRYRLGHPGCAKNCLTVGATGNGITSNRLFPASSRGPTRDGRIKPNLVAPGESIVTVLGADSTGYQLRSGTSYSAPAVSAALCLVRQYLKEGWYPNGTPDPGRGIVRPSAALLRALALSGTDANVGTGPVPNKDVGWGRLNLSSVLHFPDDSLAIAFVDERGGLATAQFHEYEFELSRREPLRVVLAWTDTAAPPQAEIALVNDLNLELISPDYNRYRGNQFLEGQSVSNPSVWDERNVEEVCQLLYPLAGRWRIRVYGRNVFTAKQPYALVVRTGKETNSLPEARLQKVVRSKVLFAKSGDSPFCLWTGNVEVYGSDGRRYCVLKPGEPLPQVGAGVFHYVVVQDGRGVESGRLVVIH